MRKLAVTLLLMFAGAGGGLWWLVTDMRHDLQLPLNITTRETLSVEPGVTLGRISRELVMRGWLDQPYYLIVEARLKRKAGNIKAGEFALEPGMTPLQLLDLLVSGRVIQYSLTLLEGWTFKQIMQAVRDSRELAHLLPSDQPAPVMASIGRAGYFAEGRFFPDTYHFPHGTTDVDFLRRAYETMESILGEEWGRRLPGVPYASPYQALIMASLIERETAVAEERPKIAGVLVRRLQRGVRLQTDPTLIYALGTVFDGDIRDPDFAVHSPYNTYLHPGLPPTPIAAPGRASIRAALQPEAGEAMYFVARGDGSHEFSETLAEHNNAVKRYQLGKE